MWHFTDSQFKNTFILKLNRSQIYLLTVSFIEQKLSMPKYYTFSGSRYQNNISRCKSSAPSLGTGTTLPNALLILKGMRRDIKL